MMRRNLLDISELLNFEKSKVRIWLDKLKFSHLLVLWLIIVALYGFVYYYGATDTSYILKTIDRVPVSSLKDSIYFSFVTATTTGFGDVVPIGSFRSIAVIEVITGLLLLAIVTSKFVSLKQNQIMKELYALSLHEKISRLRSNLFLFKQHLSRLSSNAQENRFQKLDLNNLGMYFSSYQDVLVESLTLIAEQDKELTIVDVELDLLTKSILDSAKKLLHAGIIFSEHKVPWIKTYESEISIIAELNHQLYKELKDSKMISEQTKRSLRREFKQSISKLQELA